MRLRGLKITLIDETTKLSFVEAEFLCDSEEGLINVCKFLEYNSGYHKVCFVKLHISGDKHTKIGNKLLLKLL